MRMIITKRTGTPGNTSITAEVVELGNKFRQKARKNVAVWLLWLWDTGTK